MPLLTTTEVRNRAKTASTSFSKSAAVLLTEATAAKAPAAGHDVFLSHSFLDADLILGLKLKLEQDFGLSVYVDWLADPSLDRTKVTPETAELLRRRMNSCRCLFYSATTQSGQSKWMPWECGYFDGKKGLAAILPLAESKEYGYEGQEYLGVYPWVKEAPAENSGKKMLWVHQSQDVYCSLGDWLKGTKPYVHPKS